MSEGPAKSLSRVDCDFLVARVLDRNGKPIDGLYAAGNDQASVMGGDYPSGGINLGPAMTFRFVAARHGAGADLKSVPKHKPGGGERGRKDATART